MKKPTILHFATNDFGGAGKASLRIHIAHLSAGWDSRMFVLNKTSKERNVFKLDRKTSRLRRVFKKIVYTILYRRKYLMYSVLDNNHLLKIPKVDSNIDMIFIHWVAGFISPKDIKILHEIYNAPVYWYLMDMAPITGGCHYSYGCLNYVTNCSSCPAARIDLGFTKRIKRLKEKNQEFTNYVSPNKWVSGQVNLLKEKSSKIAYIPIDPKVFKPRSHQTSNKKVKILFGSQNLHDPRKGGKYFIKAMKKLFNLISKDENELYIEVILPGDNVNGDFRNIPFDIKLIKYAKTEMELSNLYQSADIFISCSIEDSGPMMVSEALMSGLPVFAFKTGICEELIIDRENGFKIEIGDTKSLSETLYEVILDSKYLDRMKTNARKSAIELFSPDAHIKQVESFLT